MAAPMARIGFSAIRNLCRSKIPPAIISTQNVRQIQTSECQKQNLYRSPSWSTRGYTTSTEVGDDLEDDVLYRRLDVEVKGHDPEVMNSYEAFVSMAAKELDINLSKISKPPKVIERYTLLKSVHIYKKHRVQYETRTHYRTFEFKHLTGSTADTMLEYIQRNLPEGMALKVTKHRIEALPSHLKPLELTSTEPA